MGILMNYIKNCDPYIDEYSKVSNWGNENVKIS